MNLCRAIPSAMSLRREQRSATILVLGPGDIVVAAHSEDARGEGCLPAGTYGRFSFTCRV